MENTGRIMRGLTPSARRILFGATVDESIDTELTYITQVDRAHLVMLVESGIVDRERACMVLRAIDLLTASDFAPLRGRIATRGLYLLYEDYLIEELGIDTGGILHTARSRNDLNATVLRLRLRTPYLELLREALRLQAVLIKRARRFASVVMPVYTHYQAALPGTYGHYLAGIAAALQRDCADLLATRTELNTSPLGAGAVGGTSLPIQPQRTAQLLGFDKPSSHSMDAVASRDFILRLLSKSAILGTTLSRLAADLLLWLTAEFGFLTLPDELVGSSSMMPQKRNPYLLEHVQGRSGAALGAFVNAAIATHAKPFTNGISTGTEAVNPVWDALQKVTEAIVLARLVVSRAKPVESVMLKRAIDSYVTATEVANRLTLDQGMTFRAAHHLVGSMIRAASENGNALLDGLDPASVAQRSLYGGGPGVESMNAHLIILHNTWTTQTRGIREQSQKWSAAHDLLVTSVKNL